MGIHTGEPAVGGQRYVGWAYTAPRASARPAHGGQVCSRRRPASSSATIPIPDVSLRDLGEHQLKDLDEPERLYQLAAPGLGEDFPT